MKFRFEAYDRSARLVKGELEAASENEAKMKLREQALSVRGLVALQSQFTLAETFTVGKKPKLRDFALFIRQWSVMQNAGMTVIQILNILSEEVQNKNFGRVLTIVAKSIQEGSSLTQALQKHPEVFDKIFTNLIGAGESSGTLDRILERLASYYEKTDKLRKRVMGACLYPGFILFFLAAIVVGLLVFIVPVFQGMYKDQGKSLPEATQMLVDISEFMRANFLMFIAAGCGILFGIYYAFTDESARAQLDPYLIKVPVFGTILLQSSVARFTRTLGTLIQAGVPILDAVSLSAKTSGNYAVEQVAMTAQATIKEGGGIAKSLGGNQVFPRMVLSMISVGEQTGQLEKMLVKIAEVYEDEVENTVAALSSIIEPILIVTMGIIVLGVLVPLYLPVFKMGELMGN